eukprot:1812315-Amphidinium_carterae.1
MMHGTIHSRHPPRSNIVPRDLHRQDHSNKSCLQRNFYMVIISIYTNRPLWPFPLVCEGCGRGSKPAQGMAAPSCLPEVFISQHFSPGLQKLHSAATDRRRAHETRNFGMAQRVKPLAKARWRAQLGLGMASPYKSSAKCAGKA